MALTIRQLTAPSNLMRTIQPQMQAYRAGYESGPVFKNSVLIKRPSEDAALFRDKLLNVAVLPICKAIVDEIVDVVYEEEPTRHPAFLNRANNAEIPTPDWYEAFVDDADLNGNEFTAVMEQVASMAGIEGWAWVFVDLPEEINKNNRPYLAPCSAEHVIDWTTYTEFGKDYIGYLKAIEYQDANLTIYKVWYAGDAVNPTYCERYFVTDEHMTNLDQEITPTETYTMPPGIGIPVVQVLARSDQRRHDLGVSDLQEASDVQREMFKLECEAYDSIRFSKPMIRASAGIRIPAGGGGIIRGDKDAVEVFQIPTQDIAEIRAQQESLITRLDGYLGRGSMRTTKMTSAASGISIVEERRALHRKAKQRARQMQAAEEMILDLAALFMGQRWVGEVEYTTDYEDKDLQFRMALLETAAQLSATNPIVQAIIDAEVIKMISPPEDTAANLAKIGANEAEIPQTSYTYEEQGGQGDPAARARTNEIYDAEIQDKGVTTNDPIARQLITLGVGR